MAKILVVDDTALIRAMAVDLLKAAGHEADQADDGKPALEKVQQGGYDLMVLDIQMPVLDGFGVLAAVQKIAGAKPRILVMTDVANSANDVSKARVLGANGFLAKGALKEQLVFRVEQLLGRPGSP
jgi:two-component system chemotaxis response regulator CheY